ncbi:YdeI/OmpD-associated family protein [Sulfitobacter delicatus]|uniref:Bacteriocin-protection, YdeI or OmpD-Associated n=1 Tax=Sulfitobacter delicatus TaxID=218672 RepID=A0A1G7I296_9RHOB|nr:YdeI/OmpD-associated family protein [Sulfitobacter delicatus]SDF06785.1 Bacteriocin-protection, YdeI or OmpD-Associated [Sulfitobacter delicatus]
MGDMELPDDLAQALEETGAQAGWDGYSDELRADALAWIDDARTTTARSKRVDDVARFAGKGLPPTPFQ